MKKTASPAGELEILRQIRRRAGYGKASSLRLGIGDDCALIRLRRGEEMAVTTDLSIAGRHFVPDTHPADSVGHRTLARGLSDLAAMGARPVASFLSLAVPPDFTVPGKTRAWIDRFLDGFLRLAGEYKTPLAGGDLSQSPVAVADIVLVGAVPAGKALLRSGARAGDLLYVTGTLGGSAAGLKALQTAPDPKYLKSAASFLSAHLYPQPRIAQGIYLRSRGLASAALDISDGLSTDLAHLCEESGVAAEIDAALLPVAGGASLEQALHGGEDYELLFAARSGARIPLRIGGCPVSCIGQICRSQPKRPRIRLITKRGSVPLEAKGWQHFAC